MAITTSAKLVLLSNENVLGPSPRATAAMQNALTELHRYPNDLEAPLLEKLAQHIGHGLIPANFVTGNGSSDVLRMIVQSFVAPSRKAIIAAPTFGIYAGFTNLFEGTPISVPLRNYTVDLAALLDEIDAQTDLIFICNPNNPTGTFLTHAELDTFLQQLPPHVTLVLDEAYREFGDAPTLPCAAEWVAKGRNLIVSRTFSKLYGLAGLRVGYSFGRADLVARVRRYHLRHNSGRIAWLGAAAALADQEHVSQTLAMIHSGRDYYYQTLPTLGIGYVPTQGNFILLTDLPCPAEEVVQLAQEAGVILNWTEWSGLPDNVRITIGRAEENARVVETLASIIGTFIGQ